MRIDGKAIASELFSILHQKVSLLKQKGITPHIAIILVGDNPASVSYVKRKKLKTEEIGAKATVWNYESRITNHALLKKIDELNKDSTVYGIIVQRPLPSHIDAQAINHAVIPEKDIDAFHPHTPFTMPLAKAAMMLLDHVWESAYNKTGTNFMIWLKTKKIVVIGKGETGGGPIIHLLHQYNVKPNIIDSRTENQENLTQQADIIFSAVGKPNILTTSMLKKGVILISVGQHKQQDGKFHGDYEENDIQDKAAWYSPTPGGVGPVNVASLLENLVLASEKKLS